jgi:hypothetical protein
LFGAIHVDSRQLSGGTSLNAVFAANHLADVRTEQSQFEEAHTLLNKSFQVRESKLPLDIRTWCSVCIAWGVFVLARVGMRMPRNITNGLSPLEKLRFPCSILTALSSWRILRRCLPLVAAPPKPPTNRTSACSLRKTRR